jgi:hypothetical protein
VGIPGDLPDSGEPCGNHPLGRVRRVGRIQEKRGRPRSWSWSVPWAFSSPTTPSDRVHGKRSTREACNKILHASRVELGREPETDALTGELFLEGRYRGEDWHARLDLRQYGLAALALTP